MRFGIIRPFSIIKQTIISCWINTEYTYNNQPYNKLNKQGTGFDELTDKIRRMYDRLEIEPRNSEERHLIFSNIESIQLSSKTMTAVNDLLQNLEFEMCTNTGVLHCWKTENALWFGIYTAWVLFYQNDTHHCKYFDSFW